MSRSRPSFPHQLAPVVERVLGVHHDDGLAARLQHAADFVHDTARVRRVVEHAVAVDEVEGVVVERQRLGVVMNEPALQLPRAKFSFASSRCPPTGRDRSRARRDARTGSGRCRCRRRSPARPGRHGDRTPSSTASREHIRRSGALRPPRTTRACAARWPWRSGCRPGCCSTGPEPVPCRRRRCRRGRRSRYAPPSRTPARR